jgi:glyoxylase-like metal-dependent hydrolase (beta-lactamase superfamily II)
MPVIDLVHLGRERAIGAWEQDGVLVDPGPASCLERLLGELGPGFEPRAVLLTHIHLDHAGGTGTLLRRWPGLPVYVHERGARHLVRPERLVASATRLYGEAHMHRLWGEVAPVPEAALHVLSGGERVLGDYRVAYTPGHASHHVSYLHEPTGRAFVGDVAGVVIPPAGFVLAPTPPPEVDVEAWEGSLDLVAGWAPASLALTHFGAIDDVGPHLDAVRAALHAQADLVAEHDQEGFVAAMLERIGAWAPGSAGTYAQTAPLDQQYAGLERWHAKRADRG